MKFFSKLGSSVVSATTSPTAIKVGKVVLTASQVIVTTAGVVTLACGAVALVRPNGRFGSMVAAATTRGKFWSKTDDKDDYKAAVESVSASGDN